MLKRCWLILLSFILLVLLVPACGGGGEKISTPTVTHTPIPTATPIVTWTPTPTPTSSQTGPVKIGAITPWSGAAAMSGVGIGDPIIKLVEKQVKDMGGILGGREVNVVRYDNRASVAEAQAGATKLYYDDKVSVLVWGGISTA